MRSVVALAFAVSLFQVPDSLAAGKVKNIGDGWYRQKHEDANLYYLVDTKTKLCFAKAQGETVALIPCAKLKLRKKWEKVMEKMDEGDNK